MQKAYRAKQALTEQHEKRLREIAKLTEEIGQAGTVVHDVEKLITVTRKYTRVEQLTPEILNALIDFQKRKKVLAFWQNV